MTRPCLLSASQSLRQFSWSDPSSHSLARRIDTVQAEWSGPWDTETRPHAFLDDAEPEACKGE